MSPEAQIPRIKRYVATIPAGVGKRVVFNIYGRSFRVIQAPVNFGLVLNGSEQLEAFLGLHIPDTVQPVTQMVYQNLTSDAVTVAVLVSSIPVGNDSVQLSGSIETAIQDTQAAGAKFIEGGSTSLAAGVDDVIWGGDVSVFGVFVDHVAGTAPAYVYTAPFSSGIYIPPGGSRYIPLQAGVALWGVSASAATLHVSRLFKS